LLEALEQGTDELFSSLAELSLREEEEYDQQINRIRQELQQFTLDSTLSARDDERSVRTVSIVLSSLAALLGLAFAGIVTAGLDQTAQGTGLGNPQGGAGQPGYSSTREHTG
jgi:hypothetical protein